MTLVMFLLIPINLFMSNVEGIIVNTTQGQLLGESLQTVTDGKVYYSFKGIPYAKAPVGDLRFLAPQTPESWTGVRNATQHGSVCTQISIYNEVDISGSEDCLYLNVYTPNVTVGSGLAVMFFIHGGGFQSGSGNIDRFGPDYLMSQDIILVTINYRLGVLGYLSLNLTDVPGNAGMKDQVAAMKWVQNNIANFGGDPKKVTIFGQSAGGVSVVLHNLSPLTVGLYNRSVAMSGVPFNDWAAPFESRRRAFRLGQQLGFWTQNDQELLTFFRSVSAESFLGKNPAVLRLEDPKIALKQLTYTPVVETGNSSERFLTLEPVQALTKGEIRDVDLMIGHTTIEGLIYFVLLANANSIEGLWYNYTEMVVPIKILENLAPSKMLRLADDIHTKYFGDKPINNSVAKEFVDYMSQTYYDYGITKFASMFSKFRKTFAYKFSMVTNFTRHLNLANEYGINGATHEDDLLYLFYPHDGNITLNKDSEDYKLVKIMGSLYTNFAKYGNPTPDETLGIKWLQYNNDTQYYLDIDKNLTLVKNFNAETVSFWDPIYATAQVLL